MLLELLKSITSYNFNRRTFFINIVKQKTATPGARKNEVMRRYPTESASEAERLLAVNH